jgi:mannitol/fructose-specific phosphotransferase system IIA component
MTTRSATSSSLLGDGVAIPHPMSREALEAAAKAAGEVGAGG